MGADIESVLKGLFLDSPEGRRHVALFAAIPDALVPHMAPFWWHMDKLLALDLPTDDVSMTELRRFLDVPYWRAGAHAGLFQLSARDILADPAAHPDHWARTMAADLAWPITLYHEDDRAILLDGYHRVLKAEHLGMDTLPARAVPDEILSTILVHDGFLGGLNRLRLHTPSLIADARRVARELKATSLEGTFPDWS
jgi:hypothetical protein